jgi:hypothetical protein
MNLKYTVLLASGLLVGSAAAYSASSADRRSFLTQSVSSAVAGIPLVTTFLPKTAMAEDGTDDGFVTTESGLRYKVTTEGVGAVPSPGQTVKAHYTGTLFLRFVCGDNRTYKSVSPLHVVMVEQCLFIYMKMLSR